MHSHRTIEQMEGSKIRNLQQTESNKSKLTVSYLNINAMMSNAMMNAEYEPDKPDSPSYVFNYNGIDRA